MNGPVNVLAVLGRLDGDMCLPDLGEIASVIAAVADALRALRESAAALECASKCVPADLAVLLNDRALFARAALAGCGVTP